MQNLILAEEQCRMFCAKTINWLDAFWNPDTNLFRVSYSAGASLCATVNNGPNATSMLIARIVEGLDKIAQTHIREDLWEPLRQKATLVKQTVVAANLEDALPMTTMGMLPLFSVSYLGRLLALTDEPLVHPAYAVAIRRLLIAAIQEHNDLHAGMLRPDRLHPFLLHGCVRNLLDFNLIFKNAYATNNKNTVDTFLKNFNNVDLVMNAAKKRLGPDFTRDKQAELEQMYGCDAAAVEFLDVMKRLSKTDYGNSRNIIDKLIAGLEESAANEVAKQIVRGANRPGPDMDPSALVYSVATLAQLNPTRHAHLISQGLCVVFANCESGVFHASMPFKSDEKGRSVFVPSVEIAGKALSVYLRHIGEVHRSDDNTIIDASSRLRDRLCEHYNTVELHDKDGKVLLVNGWCTDKAPSHNRVDAWVMIHALSFFLSNLELIRVVKKRLIVEHYSWIPAHDCKPKWSDITEPDLGLATIGVKERIMSVVSSSVENREKAPVFLLYGPPGTSKTTMVQALAQEIGWDLIMLSPSDFIADGIDRIEQRSRNVFNDLMNMNKCIVLMDEMDSLLRDRDILRKHAQGSQMEFVVPAFLPKLQALRDYVHGRQMAVFLLTNYYETIDRALLRSGRIDHHLLILPFSLQARLHLITQFLPKKWHRNGVLLKSARKKIETLLGDCAPLLCYRDIEQIGKMIASCWPHPRTKTPPELNDLDKCTSISPDIYAPDKRDNAHAEFCAVLHRMQNFQRDDGRFSQMSPKDAYDYLRLIAAKKPEDVNIPVPWHSMATNWEKELKKILTLA